MSTFLSGRIRKRISMVNEEQLLMLRHAGTKDLYIDKGLRWINAPRIFQVWNSIASRGQYHGGLTFMREDKSGLSFTIAWMSLINGWTVLSWEKTA